MSDDEPPRRKRKKEGGGEEPSTPGLLDPVLAGTEEDKCQFTPPRVISNYLENTFDVLRLRKRGKSC